MKEQSFHSVGNAIAWRAIQMGGTKAIFLIRLLVLARLLTPADFGLVTIGVSAIAFLMSITNFGMVEALVQGETADDQRYNAAWTIIISRAFVVSAGVFILAPVVADIYGEPRSVEIIRFLALRPLLDGLASIKVAGLTRELHFRPLTLLNLLNAIANTLLSIVLAAFFGVWGLVIGTLAGSAAYLIGSYLVAPHRPRLVIDREVARPLLQFGRWVYLTSVIVMIGGNVLQIAISRQLGTAELGLYYLATQIAFLPYEVASEVVGSVAFPLYARLQRNLSQVTATFRIIFSSMAAVLFPSCALIFAVAPTLVDEVLGSGWEGTAPIIRVLTLAAVVGLLADASTPIFRGLGKPSRVAALELAQSSILIASVWSLAGRFGVVGAAAAWLPGILASQFIAAIYLQRMLVQPFKGLERPMLAILVAASSGALIAYGFDTLVSGPVGLGFAGAAGSAVAFGILWLGNRRFHLGFTHNLTLFYPQLFGRPRVLSADAGPTSR